MLIYQRVTNRIDIKPITCLKWFHIYGGFQHQDRDDRDPHGLCDWHEIHKADNLDVGQNGRRRGPQMLV